MHALLRQGEEIHEKVRGRVKPGRWEAYMRIIVRGDDIGETAAALGHDLRGGLRGRPLC